MKGLENIFTTGAGSGESYLVLEFYEEKFSIKFNRDMSKKYVINQLKTLANMIDDFENAMMEEQLEIIKSP